MRGRRLVSRKRQPGTETFSPPLPRRSPPAIRHPNRRPTAHVGLSADSRLPGTATRRRLVQAILGRRALPRTERIRVSGVELGYADQFERDLSFFPNRSTARLVAATVREHPTDAKPCSTRFRRCCSTRVRSMDGKPSETLRTQLFASFITMQRGATRVVVTTGFHVRLRSPSQRSSPGGGCVTRGSEGT